jgi:hypothetical protein
VIRNSVTEISGEYERNTCSLHTSIYSSLYTSSESSPSYTSIYAISKYWLVIIYLWPAMYMYFYTTQQNRCFTTRIIFINYAKINNDFNFSVVQHYLIFICCFVETMRWKHKTSLIRGLLCIVHLLLYNATKQMFHYIKSYYIL